MKTITQKDALKLFLFLLILLSAKTFSHPRLPNLTAPGDCESRVGVMKKAANNPATTSAAYASKDNVMKSKRNCRFKK